MICIYCGSETGVINSRPQKRLNKTWRRRQCKKCQQIFTTIEAVDYSGAWRVAQYDGSLSVFSRDTLFASIYESCKHRPSPSVDASALTDTIISKIAENIDNSLVPRKHIIELSHQTLVAFDTAAAVQYIAYHPI